MHVLWRMLSLLGLYRRNATVLVVGLDNSGKTTILEHLKPRNRNLVAVVPTVGFSIDTFARDGIKFKAFDMSGASKYRRLWEKYYKETDAVVFVVDSSDRLRLAVAREELCFMLGTYFASKNNSVLTGAYGSVSLQSIEISRTVPFFSSPTNRTWQTVWRRPRLPMLCICIS